MKFRILWILFFIATFRKGAEVLESKETIDCNPEVLLASIYWSRKQDPWRYDG
jgi:hypothetical protein